MGTPLFSLPSVPAAGKTLTLGQLQGSARGALIAQAAGAHAGVTLVIAASPESAAELESEIAFYDNNLELLSFPDWETLPYDNFSPHQDITSQRIHSLYRLQTLTQGILIVPAATLVHRLPPKQYLSAQSLVLEKGQQLDVEATRHRLVDAGYQPVNTVYEHGEFAVRGAILDIFPMGSPTPYRIDLFDDEIDTLRTFDPDSQLSVEQIERIQLLPAKEFPLNPAAIARFRQQWRDAFDVDPRKCPVYLDVSDGLAPAGIEYYLPLFFDQTCSLLDYLPTNTLLISDENPEPALREFWHDIDQRYESRRYDIERPILPPQRVFHPIDALFGQFKQLPRVQLHKAPIHTAPGKHNLGTEPPQALPVDAKAKVPLQAILSLIDEHNGKILFCAESPGRREALLELLRGAGIKPVVQRDLMHFRENTDRIGIVTAPLELGLTLPSADLVIVTEAQLFGQRVLQRRRRQKAETNTDLIFRNLAEMHIDSAVVHDQHGVGRYKGLQTLEIDGQAHEFLTLMYADEAKLYVPVASLHLISRYSGSSDSLAPIHRLGTDLWSKAKRKAAEKIRDTAAELLDIYARRAARKGFRFDQPDQQYLAFAAGFPFEETPDQQNSIDAVIRDMTANTPMDRLVCGDVGFGKTEVALRAAFIAVQSSKQVAILAPTTLLAQQHFQTFSDRFADWPVKIELLSRFRTTKEQSQTMQHLSEGKADIVIGTHKLLSKELNFKQLGLLIIDEEHRFGVQQKERLKSLRANVDILTLTATPIPRTLNMAMSGMRDLSIIATPPARRLSVKTFVRESDDSLIKEAILRELLRGGQVYYLHNEVKTIHQTADSLHALVPEARITVAHGQMRERDLEQVMSDFYHKRFNVMVCSTIIETGIDIPNANTIIIDRADKFGLAQLHQLRGRVGRSHHQAYAYMLTPNQRNISADASKRLAAIEAADTLGAGFTLATHDLEIRGAGELLGEEQSGQMQAIGYTLYMELLDEAIQSIKQGKVPEIDKPLHHGAEINLRLPALIPEDYLPDVHNRLVLYKRISGAKNDAELRELQVEMIDRFGLLPEPVKNLFRMTALKIRAQKIGIAKIDAGAASGRLEFTADTLVNPLTIVTLVQTQPHKYGLEGSNQLKFKLTMASSEQRFQALEQLMSQLQPQDASK